MKDEAKQINFIVGGSRVTWQHSRRRCQMTAGSRRWRRLKLDWMTDSTAASQFACASVLLLCLNITELSEIKKLDLQ